MNDTAKRVLERLDEIGIRCDTVSHPEVHSIEDCRWAGEQLNALVVKNYFLTTKNEKHFYVCIVRPNVRFRTADVSKQAGSSRLSFGNEAQLNRLLHTYPGAVTPLGLLFDADRQVGLIADKALADLDRIAFHPCDSTQTVAMNAKDFFDVFLPAVGVSPVWVEIHDFLDT